MTITCEEFIREHTGNPVYIPGMATAECVALFWAFNREVNQGESYSAEGAANLWEQPVGTPYLWDTYERVPGAGSGLPFDWAIWSGQHGAYPNGGYGHVAQFLKDFGDGTGLFFSQNPNAPAEIRLSYNGVLGFLRMPNAPHDAAQVFTRIVTNLGGCNARTAPNTSAPLAPSYPDGIANGATLSVVGYVQGQDVNGNGDDAWYKTISGYYVWANNAQNDISNLPFLGKLV
jgi:hypothetical protein